MTMLWILRLNAKLQEYARPARAIDLIIERECAGYACIQRLPTHSQNAGGYPGAATPTEDTQNSTAIEA